MHKYKFKDLEKILNGGVLDSNFNVNIDGVENSIYLGMSEKNKKGNVVDTQCNSEEFEQLYKISKEYLDSLSKFDNYVVWIYSIGSLARFLNNYLLNRFKIENLFQNNKRKKELSKFEENIFNNFNRIIIYLLAFENKFEGVKHDILSPILNDLSKRIVENFKNNYDKYIKNLKGTLNPDEMKRINTSFQKELNLKGHIENYKINQKNALDKFREYVNKSVSNKDMYYLIDSMVDEYLTQIDMTQIFNILKDTMIRITTNSPKLPKTIKLYKSIGGTEKDYQVGQKSKQVVINSVTCSRQTNLGMFINIQHKCCLFEITCKEGVPALFLDYEKTAYGKQMSEVILPPNITFSIKSKEMKKILSYDFKDQEKNLSEIVRPQPYINLSYDKPVIVDMMVYEIECEVP